jgi:signal peptidase I
MVAYLGESSSILFIMIMVAGLIHFVVIEPSEVDGHSMKETYHDGDLILIDKLSLLTHRPKRGDVVSFFGEYTGTLLIKRVIGLPGEIVILEKGRVIIQAPDGKRSELVEPYLPAGSVTLPETGHQFTYPPLGEDEYFLLGDNRERSDDSRAIGPIKRSQIIGLVH